MLLEKSHFKSEIEIKKKFDELKTLYEIGSILVSSLDQHVIRTQVVAAITKLINVEAGSLLMVDEEKKELYFEVALGEKGDEVKEIKLKIGEGIAGWVAEHGQSVLVPDVVNDVRFSKKADDKTKFVTKNILCVPVKIKGKVIAVLQAINKIDDSFTQDDLDILEMFSNQVAIALDNARLYSEIKETFIATIEALAEAIEKRDPYTGGHTRRVLNYSLAIAMYLNMSNDDEETLKFSAILHDIGKIGIDDSILSKQMPLKKEEADIMKRHTIYGSDILGHVKHLKGLIPGMFAHHERPDGKGYPMGLEGDEIPLIAKIISVADAYDAITTDRPYRKGLAPNDAVNEIRRCAGTQFDKDVVDAFIKAFENGEI
ncbi:MAG: HD domain-containing protein [Deltaproteobacteria bacterium]|nr:HD domain-containing protein [Deltaproteobacteria bacterium]